MSIIGKIKEAMSDGKLSLDEAKDLLKYTGKVSAKRLYTLAKLASWFGKFNPEVAGYAALYCRLYETIKTGGEDADVSGIIESAVDMYEKGQKKLEKKPVTNDVIRAGDELCAELLRQDKSLLDNVELCFKEATQ